MNIHKFGTEFLDAVVKQKKEMLREFFTEDAVIDWVCTKERFTLDEYIIANCEYPGDWTGNIVLVESLKSNDITFNINRILMISHISTIDYNLSFHVTSIIHMEHGKIRKLIEYFAEDGQAPNWRIEKGIGINID